MDTPNDKYKKIENALSSIPDHYTILEDEVDIEIQKEYFSMSDDLGLAKGEIVVAEAIEELNRAGASDEEKKHLLLELASSDSVEAYRAIEKFKLQCDDDLVGWAALALQQSRMVLESGLIGENKVLISTGLGGKDDKLRYLFVFPYCNGEITDTQKKIFESEIRFFVDKYNGEIESVEVFELYAKALMLIPIKTQISNLIKDLFEECNQFGAFLCEDNVIITNVKKLSDDEIMEIISSQGIPDDLLMDSKSMN